MNYPFSKIFPLAWDSLKIKYSTEKEDREVERVLSQ